MVVLRTASRFKKVLWFFHPKTIRFQSKRFFFYANFMRATICLLRRSFLLKMYAGSPAFLSTQCVLRILLCLLLQNFRVDVKGFALHASINSFFGKVETSSVAIHFLMSF